MQRGLTKVGKNNNKRNEMEKGAHPKGNSERSSSILRQQGPSASLWTEGKGPAFRRVTFLLVDLFFDSFG